VKSRVFDDFTSTVSALIGSRVRLAEFEAKFLFVDDAPGLRVGFRKMPYEFTEWEHEPEPEASSSRTGGPPRKVTGIGILDPPSPPKR
jgi:hypothetical protein